MLFTRLVFSYFSRVIVASFSGSYSDNCVFVVNSASTWYLSLDIIATRFSITASIFFSCDYDSTAEFAPNPLFSAVNCHGATASAGGETCTQRNQSAYENHKAGRARKGISMRVRSTRIH